MFGDKPIIGYAIRKMDVKGRIPLPDFTGVTDGDTLIVEKDHRIMFNNNEIVDEVRAFKIYAYKNYLEMFDKYHELMDNAKTIEDYLKYKELIEDISSEKAFVAVIQDKQKRLKFPKDVLDSAGWKSETNCVMEGLGNTLLVKQK